MQKQKKKTKRTKVEPTIDIVVLADGETYSGIRGCRIMCVTPRQLRQIESGERKPCELDSFIFKNIEELV